MGRYIKAEDMKKEVLRISTSPLNEWDTWGVLNAIDRVETADVAPVKHAKWEDDGETIFCSLCKKEAGLKVFTYKFHPTTDTWEGDIEWDKSNYCPECGAIMDG